MRFFKLYKFFSPGGFRRSMQEDWCAALKSYRAYYESIASKLPATVKNFACHSLHDEIITGVAVDNGTVVLHTDHHVIQFLDVREQNFLDIEGSCFLYGELDIAAGGIKYSFIVVKEPAGEYTEYWIVFRDVAVMDSFELRSAEPRTEKAGGKGGRKKKRGKPGHL